MLLFSKTKKICQDNATLFVFLLVFFSLFSIVYSQESMKGDVNVENGIKVIKNPETPLFGKLKLKLKKDLVIGNGNDENSAFLNPINDIKVDKNGNIYIYDYGNLRIKKFDKNGLFLFSVGKKGDNPGEFSSKYNLSFIVDNYENIYVYCYRKLHFFDKNGQFIKTTSFPSLDKLITLNSDGNIFGYSSDWTKKGGNTHIIYLIDKGGRILSTIATFQDHHNNITKENNYEISFVIPNAYFHSYLNNSIVFGYSEKYKIYLSNSQGNVNSIIEKNEVGREISDNEKWELLRIVKKTLPMTFSELRNKIHFPSSWPVFNGIFCDDKGRLYVRRYDLINRVARGKEKRWFDFYNEKGQYLYKLNCKLSVLHIEKGFLYDASRNMKSKSFSLTRYIIENWDELSRSSKRKATH